MFLFEIKFGVTFVFFIASFSTTFEGLATALLHYIVFPKSFNYQALQQTKY